MPPMKTRIIILACLVSLLFVANIFFGSVHIDLADTLRIITGSDDVSAPLRYIVINSRLPQAVTALLAGAGLAVSGLMLQTSFHNPLAGPSILGITSGANLGVALVMLAFGGTVSAGLYTLNGNLAIVGAAFAGSLLIMSILMALSALLKNNLMLLITGIMMGYITSAVISLLNFVASEDSIHGFIIWGMGSFGGVSLEQLPFFSSLCGVGLLLSLLLVKPLNAILLGENYAVNLGLNIQRTRHLLLLATGLLTAVITAYCGPVSFIGLAVPHIAFLVMGTSNHRASMPATMLTGAAVALFCNLVCTMPASTVIPLSAVTPIIGAPVILYIICKRGK